MPRLRLLVVDQTPSVCAQVCGFLESEPGLEIVRLAEEDGEHAMAAVEQERPDILFWDSDLSECGGAELLPRLSMQPLPVIVIASAYPRFAVDAFRIGVVDYLLKPIDGERCRVALQRAVKRVQRQRAAVLSDRLASDLTAPEAPRPRSRIMVRTDGRLVVVNLTDIVWIEAARNRAILHMLDGKTWRLRCSLQQLEERFRTVNFLRISRSALVATAHIRELLTLASGTRVLTLQGGARLPLKRNWQACIERLFEGAD